MQQFCVTHHRGVTEGPASKTLVDTSTNLNDAASRQNCFLSSRTSNYWLTLLLLFLDKNTAPNAWRWGIKEWARERTVPQPGPTESPVCRQPSHVAQLSAPPPRPPDEPPVINWVACCAACSPAVTEFPARERGVGMSSLHPQPPHAALDFGHLSFNVTMRHVCGHYYPWLGWKGRMNDNML